ncbi:hypothetical protein ACOSP7_004764 [Xanthoceras sorbifolium]
MRLAGTIGDVVEFPLESNGCWGKFLKVKVRIDITKPLKRGIRVWLEEFKTMITSPIKFEKLPEFCFACGLVGHSLKECLDEEARTCVINGSVSKYGVWLQASPPERTKIRQKDEGTGDNFGFEKDNLGGTEKRGEVANSDREDSKAVRNCFSDSSIDTRKKNHLEIVSKIAIQADFVRSQGCVNKQNHVRSLFPVLSQGPIVIKGKEVVVGNIVTEAIPNVNSGGDQGLELEGSMMQGIDIDFTSGNLKIGPILLLCQPDCFFSPNLEDQVLMDTSKPVARKWKKGAIGRPPNKGWVSGGHSPIQRIITAS